MYKVYLAGPITGCDYEGATNWRDYASYNLRKGNLTPNLISGFPEYEDTGIIGYSPMRAKGYLKEMAKMPDSIKDKPLSTIEAILNRDHWDCKTSDAILVNVLGNERVSIGTVMELAWAYAYRIPTVLVAEPEDVHRHGMIVASLGWHTTDLDEGIQMIKNILLP